MQPCAIEIREVSALLQQDRALMRLWKGAARAGRIEAVSIEDRNYAVIHDEALLDHLRSRVHGITLLAYDAQRRAVARAPDR